MECDVKMAEIQILRKRLQTLQEQIVSLNGRMERHYSIPVLSTPTFENPRFQQTSTKVPSNTNIPKLMGALKVYFRTVIKG